MNLPPYLLKLMARLKRAKWFVFTGLLFLVAFCTTVFAVWVRPTDTLQSLIPGNIREQVELFERSPFNQKVFVVVSSQDGNNLLAQAHAVQNYLTQQGLIRPGFNPAPDFALTLLHALPFRFLPTDREPVLEKLTQEAVARSVKENYERITSLEGVLLRPLVQADPFHLLEIMTRKLAAFNPQTGLDYQDGFLTANDGKTLVGLYDLSQPTHFSNAQRFSNAIQYLNMQLPKGTEVFYLGGLRYTADNVSRIQHDLRYVTLFGIICLVLVFVLLLRSPHALFIYMLPLLVLPIAALGTYLIFGNISGITLGFGSVVVGLCVDYGIYLFYAVVHGNLPAHLAARKLRQHIGCNFLTSALCFTALFFSSVEVFRQIAVFAILGLTVALFVALFILPIYWERLSTKSRVLSSATAPSLLHSPVLAWLLSAVIVTFGVWGIYHTNFSGDLEALNATSSLLLKQKAVLSHVFEEAEANNALVFVKGKTKEAALENNEIISAGLPHPLATAEMIPSEKGRANHVQQWKEFWSHERIEDAKTLLQQSAQQVGFSTTAFDPFFKWLEEPETQNLFDFTKIYNPIISLHDGTFAVVNFVPNSPQVQELAKQKNVVYVTRPELKTGLMQAMKKETLRIALLAFLLNLIAVSVVFKKFTKALFAFIPVILAACFTFGCFALFKVEVNLFALVFLPLLMGLGIDYGIFQLEKAETAVSQLYPSVALVVAGLSTLAGFGVLIVAHHPVLHMMGVSSCLGVGSAMLVALLILPAILEHTK